MPKTLYPTHPCLYDSRGVSQCTGNNDNVQTNDHPRQIADIRSTLSSTNNGTIAYSYALTDYYNAVQQAQAELDSTLDGLGNVSGSVNNIMNAQYESTMIAGVMWATLGTVLLYFTFTGLNK